jgi:hypothetical protein
MPDEVEGRIWVRVHDNGWVSYVLEFIHGAVSEYAAGASLSGRSGRTLGRYDTFEKAAAAADENVRRSSDHPSCSPECNPW